jgi:SAM-dependent methyltransferase
MENLTSMSDHISEIKSRLAPVEQWLSIDALEHIYSAGYWNDIEQEKQKGDFWITDGSYARCMSYLKQAGLLDEWAIVEKYLREFPSCSKLIVADVAAGIGWTSALLSKLDNVAEVNAIEISTHRLTELFPYAVDMMGGYPEKIRRYLGSFYALGFDAESMDVVFLSQAFHHADQPLKLLTEIDRVTRKGGVILLTGENHIGLRAMTKAAIKMLLGKKQFSFNFHEIFPPDDITGDHYYRLSDYYTFFRLLGYKLRHEIVSNRSVVLIAQKEQ